MSDQGFLYAGPTHQAGLVPRVRTIWKYVLRGGMTIILAPADGLPVLVGLDPATGGPAVWIELDPAEPNIERRFAIRGTGHEIGRGECHIGSYFDGAFVWHVYEQPR